MKKFTIKISTCLLIFLLVNKISSTTVDFETSMGEKYMECIRKDSGFDIFIKPRNCKDVLSFLKFIYDKINLDCTISSSDYKIPPIIHQIWIGSPLPKKYQTLQDSWKKNHPDWTYVLWTDKEVANLPMINRDLYDQAEYLVDKVDILRYELLNQFGGLYVDMDMECVKPFDILHRSYDFYTCLAPLYFSFLIINNAVIGATPAHPIISYCLNNMKNNLPQLKKEREIHGPTLPIFAGLHFTPSILNTIELCQGMNIVFPPTFFYPDPTNVKPESFAIHYWHASWIGL